MRGSRCSPAAWAEPGSCRDSCHGIRTGSLPGVAPDAEVTVIANTADDLWIHGLKVCPDLDTVMYTLGDGIDPERGWGRRDETWSVEAELAAYGVEPTWFGLGDRDIATHLVRTQMLDAGYPLSAGHRGPLPPLALPSSGVPAAADDRRPGRDPRRDRRRRRAQRAPGGALPGVLGAAARRRCPAETVVFVGLEDVHPRARASSTRSPTPTWCCCRRPTRWSRSAPSSASRGCARRSRPPAARSSASPPSSAAPTSAGWPSRCSTSIGVEVSAAGVGLHYGARTDGGVLDGWLVDERDADQVARVRAAGSRCRAVPLMMTDHDATAAMAAAAVDLVADDRP